MRLTTRGQYAVQAMLDLAGQKQMPVSLSEIARRQRISLSYLEQLFMRLRRAGLVQSVRGPGGGYVLARPPKDIRLSKIILSVEEPIRMTRCSHAQRGCTGLSTRCVAHGFLEDLGHHVMAYLNSVTLAETLARRRGRGVSTEGVSL